MTIMPGVMGSEAVTMLQEARAVMAEVLEGLGPSPTARAPKGGSMEKVNRRQVLKQGAALAAAGVLGQGFAREFYASPPPSSPAPAGPGWWWWGAAGAG